MFIFNSFDVANVVNVAYVAYVTVVDDRCKSMFTYTEGIPLIMGMIVNFPQQFLAKELAALAVNLSLNPRNAEIMISNKGLNHMMDRLSTTRDPLLLKIIRNISQWTFNLQKVCQYMAVILSIY